MTCLITVSMSFWGGQPMELTGVDTALKSLLCVLK